MTKREAFELIKTVVDNEELIAFCDHEIELLNKKYSGSKKETKVQIENKEICKMLKEVLWDNQPITVSEILEIPSIREYVTVEGKSLSNQKVSRLLNDMTKAGDVVKTIEKKKSYFSLA